MHPITALTPFKPVRGRASAVVLLLWASLFVSGVQSISNALQIITGQAGRLSSDEVSPFDFVDLGISLIFIITFIATVVTFCLWLHRAYQNLTALGNPKQGLKHSPGWAVGSFFVPFVNLVYPFRAVRETWAKSDPLIVADDYVAPTEADAPGLMKLWWGFWIASNIIGNASFRVRMNATTTAGMSAATWLDLFSDLLTIPAAIFAIRVVRDITARQEARSQRVRYVSNTLPPPPIFSTMPPPVRP